MPEPGERLAQPPDTVRILGVPYLTGPKVKMKHLVVLAAIDWMMRLLLGREKPAPPPDLAGKVLAVSKIDLLGDVLMITPLLRELRVQTPSTRLVLIVGSWSAEAGRLLVDEGLCDALIVYDPPTMSPAAISWPRKIRQWLVSLRTARAELLREKVDVFLDLRSSSPNSLLLARLVHVRHKVGYALRGYSYLLQQSLPYDGQIPMGQQYLDALAIFNLSPVPYEKPLLHWKGGPEPLPASMAAEPAFCVLHPFSRNPRKMIAAAWWRQTLECIAAGRRVVVLGTRGDLENGPLIEVLTAAGCDLSAVGRTTFRQAVACVRESAAFVGVDSVFSHVALAFDKPTYVAAIAGASYRPAFPRSNTQLYYDEIRIDRGPSRDPSPIFQNYCERIGAGLHLHPAQA